eukprot:7387432-Lingulodinium_polyedra.AAC.1
MTFPVLARSVSAFLQQMEVLVVLVLDEISPLVLRSTSRKERLRWSLSFLGQVPLSASSASVSRWLSGYH